MAVFILRYAHDTDRGSTCECQEKLKMQLFQIWKECCLVRHWRRHWHNLVNITASPTSKIPKLHQAKSSFMIICAIYSV